MNKVTLTEALADAGHYIYRLNERWGVRNVERAIAYHEGKNLRAYLLTGITQDDDGQQMRFLNYDWSHLYDGMPEWVFADFFMYRIANSCARMERGLDP